MNCSKYSFVGIIFLLLSIVMNVAYATPGHGNNNGNHGNHGFANKNNHGVGHGSHHSHFVTSKQNTHLSKKAVSNNKIKFSKTEKTKIINYFTQNPLHGTALPPGIAMNVARGKPLPPGIAKQFLAPDLLSTLPTYPGYQYVVVGKDVALVNENTNIIADIISNVLP